MTNYWKEQTEKCKPTEIGEFKTDTEGSRQAAYYGFI